MTDLNTWDDIWNEGFEDYFDGALLSEARECGFFALAWAKGWHAARGYRHSMIKDSR